MENQCQQQGWPQAHKMGQIRFWNFWAAFQGSGSIRFQCTTTCLIGSHICPRTVALTFWDKCIGNCHLCTARLFTNQLGSEHQYLLCYTKVRWLFSPACMTRGQRGCPLWWSRVPHRPPSCKTRLRSHIYVACLKCWKTRVWSNPYRQKESGRVEGEMGGTASGKCPELEENEQWNPSSPPATV